MDTIPLLFIFFNMVLRIKPSASHVRGKCSATEPQPQPLFIYLLCGAEDQTQWLTCEASALPLSHKPGPPFLFFIL